MINFRRLVALCLLVMTVGQLAPPAGACGPSYVDPIFISTGSPDPPFESFVNGNIGIVLPTFGRKTLVIAYRYLNGGSFSHDEQKELIKALKGDAPDQPEDKALTAWITARKDVVGKDEPTPEIYVERRYGGYDFFPNCGSNAFEVASETLKDRAARFGHESQDVRNWIVAQDVVFQNCMGGSSLPGNLGKERPEWLRKDRQYQIAAALFYSLELDEARERFAEIAADNNSPWQQTAEYLVGRTLVRQASLTKDELKKRQLYRDAEVCLLGLVGKGGKFYDASKRLLGLVKYRSRPEERVRELARSLSFENGNSNLRQDLIDYVWLLDGLQSRALREQAKREQGPSPEEESVHEKEARERLEAVQRGEQIVITLDTKIEDFSMGNTIYFSSDVSRSAILESFEVRLGRKLTAQETKDIVESHESALKHREWLSAPNRQLHMNDYEGGEQGTLPRDLTPEFLLADDLSDWILTVQTGDDSSYAHAVKRWRETGSHAWLIASLIKAKGNSPELAELLRAAREMDRGMPAFAGSMYHLVRLNSDAGKKTEARELLDQLIQSGIDHLPVSAQNLLAEQRMRLAENLDSFLRAALRTPVAFNDNGRLVGKLKFFEPPDDDDYGPDSDRFQLHQQLFPNVSAEDFRNERLRYAQAEFQQRSPWTDRMLLDSETTEILNTHFSLSALIEVLRSPALPEYLRPRIALAIWTRAFVLEKQNVAEKIAPEILNFAPELRTHLSPYLTARTAKEKERAALFLLLQNVQLSPLIAYGLPPSIDQDDLSYYYESAWWCAPSLTEYNMEGEQVAKKTPVPTFLSPAQMTEARRDYLRLIEIGGAKSYLGKRVLEWAKASPNDPRIPEALFIASSANSQYKYGCDGWEYDRETKAAAETLLRERYPNSPWTKKLSAQRN